MSKSIKDKKIAVVGATGNVGRTIISILAERFVPASNIHAVASIKSAGRQISYGEHAVLTVQALDSFDFTQCDLAFFSPGGKISKEWAPKVAKQGCIVIDKTSEFRMDPDVPLIVPEVNADALKDCRRKNIIANPNCTTIPLMVILNILKEIAPLKRVVVSTYQSVSGAGKEGMDELFNQTRGTFMNSSVMPQHFVKPIAFNVIPQIDSFMDDGSTKEEWKMAVEAKKILGIDIKLTATCVRVPVFIGHSMAVNIEFDGPINPQQAKQNLQKAKGVQVIDNREEMEFITPIECAGEDTVFVSRIRQDTTLEHGLSLWISCDNLRKGAALNAVQIAQTLIKEYL